MLSSEDGVDPSRHPPAWISDRIALQDDAYKDFRFPKGTIVILFYYGLHRDPRHWQDPGAFVPGRFSKEQEKERAKVYFPFGGGPRLCIGNNFAMAEMAIFLHAFVQRFNVKPSGILPRMNPLVTLKPDRVVLELAKLG